MTTNKQLYVNFFLMKDQGVGSSNSYDNLAAVATFKNLTK